MPNIPPISAEITVMAYPTEVEDKVKGLLLFFAGDAKIKEDRFTSYYGYSFKIMKASLSKKEAVEALRLIICGLKEYELYDLLNNLESHIEGKNLYIRLNKQDLTFRRIALYNGGPGGYIRVKFTFPKFTPSDLREYLSNLRDSECTQT